MVRELRLSRLTGGAVLAISAALVLVELTRIGLTVTRSDFAVALAATAISFPLHVWHLRHGLRGERPEGSGRTLAVMAATNLAALLAIGPQWSYMLATLATSALIVLPLRRAAAVAALCALGPVLADVVHPGDVRDNEVTVFYLVYAVAFRSVLQFALVWLVAAANELARSRAALAAAATERERTRIEAEVRRALERRVSTIATAGRRARSALDGPGVAAALILIDRALALSHRSLSDVRSAVAGTRHATAPAEVPSAPVHDVTRAARLPALAVQVAVLGFTLLAPFGVFDPTLAVADERAAAGGWLLMAALYVSLALDAARGRRPRYGLARWLTLLALTIILLVWLGWPMRASVWLAGAGGAFALGERRVLPLIGGFAAAISTYLTVKALSLDPTAAELVWFGGYWLVVSSLAMLGLFASARLVAVVAELDATREALAVEAARAERERLSGDLHDVLGQGLTAISLKADLARRLVRRDRATAARELDELVALADGQSDELEAVARNERHVALASEAEGAIALLRAAGVEVDADLELDGIDTEASEVLGWAIREGTTNVLRHAAAGRCTIRCSGGENGHVRLELVNDGVRARPASSGTGLVILGERMAARGGVVDAGPLPHGGFRLAVELPTTVPA